MATRKPVVTGMNLNIRDFTQNTGVKDKNKRKYYCGSGTLNSMLKMWGFLLNLSSIRAINKYDPVSVEFSQSAICTISSPAHVSCLSSHCTCAKKFSSVLFRFVPFVLLDAESVLTFFFFFCRNARGDLLKDLTSSFIQSALHSALFSPDQIVPHFPVNPNTPALMFLPGSLSVSTLY